MAETLERRAVEPKASARGFATLLTHVEPELASSHRTEVAARLAREFGARLIGLGAEALDVSFAADPYAGVVLAEWVEAAQKEVTGRLKSAERSFVRDAAGAETEWRSVQDYPGRALSRAARAADLVVVSEFTRGTDGNRRASPSDVVMGAGRPVLIVPENGRHLRAANIVVAWKDTREARRAVADALPFLVRAEQVIVQAVTEDVEAAAFQTNDVADALKRHGVAARPNVTKGPDGAIYGELQRIADLNDADLIVAGAYGHSRLAEWAFGGLTDELLHTPGRFVLTSH